MRSILQSVKHKISRLNQELQIGQDTKPINLRKGENLGRVRL